MTRLWAWLDEPPVFLGLGLLVGVWFGVGLLIGGDALWAIYGTILLVGPIAAALYEWIRG